MPAERPLVRLVALETWVVDEAATEAFWRRLFHLQPDTRHPLSYTLEGLSWRMLPDAQPCGTRGPHGVVPAWNIADFGAARGALLTAGVPVVFAEMLPGASLLVFLDPSANAIELLQPEDPKNWDIARRRALRSHRRHDDAPSLPLTLHGLQELSIYTHDVTASVRFYRDVLGLPTGLAYFGHVHLVAENVPVVIRASNTRCREPQHRHGSEPVFAVPDWDALQGRVQQADISILHAEPRRLTLRDPIGLRVHVLSAEE